MKSLTPAGIVRIAVFLGVVVLFVAISFERGHEAHEEGSAIRAVGSASMLYQTIHGKPPRNVDDLFGADLLRDVGDGMVRSPMHGLPVRADEVRRVEMRFPEDADRFEVREGFVRSIADGQIPSCLRIDGTVPVGCLDWDYIWFQVANNHASGVEWLDELVAKHTLRP